MNSANPSTTAAANRRVKILVLVDTYLPGFKSGGPVRSIANLVAHMPPHYEFWIYTKDRDFGDARPYEQITVDAWSRVGRANVFYASRAKQGIFALVRAMREVNADLVYSNSLFGRMNIRYLVARRVGMVPRVPFVLAPRGELSQGALTIKPVKKHPFLALAHRAGLLREIIWQASTAREAEDIARALGVAKFRGNQPVIVKSANLVAAGDLGERHGASSSALVKTPGTARLAFVGRVVRMKNLEFAVRCLGRLRGRVSLDVIGPIEDPAYWESIQARVRGLPEGITVRALGSLPHDEVGERLQQVDFMVLPTLGENFGHAIYEALSCGCPVVLSDRTPWRGLAEAKAGWDLSLDHEEQWVEVLQRCIDMESHEHQQYARGARDFAHKAYPLDKLIRENEALFERALQKK